MNVWWISRVVPAMSEHFFELMSEKPIEGDAFSYVHNVCVAGLSQLNLLYIKFSQVISSRK